MSPLAHTNSDSVRRARRVALASVATGALAGGFLLPGAAHADEGKAPGPAKLQVSRTGGDSTDLKISWSPVAKAEHYTVNVFDGSKDRATVVSKSETSMVFDGEGSCTRYQVRVSATDDKGRTGRTGTFYVPWLAPGAVANLKWSGSALSWDDPKLPGVTPVTEYKVEVKKIATGETVFSKSTTENKIDVPGIEDARTYQAKVTAINEFGSCSAAAQAKRGTQTQTDAPSSLRIVRDPATPSRVVLSWEKPSWANEHGVKGYRIAYRAHGKKDVRWIEVGPDTYKTEISLDPEKNYDFQIKVIGGDGKHGKVSKPIMLVKLGSDTKAEPAVSDPDVRIREDGAKVIVEITGPVGSAAKYSNLDLRIAPTLDGAGFRDQHLITNGANKVIFGDVPCGIYTVLVTGQGKETAREFGRIVLNRCDTNVVPADKWKLVFGRADIKGNYVAMPYGNESRVISTLSRATRDMVFTTEAKLSSGWGYGIWTRADFNAASGVSGYSFQYDPGYGKGSSFGPALLVRVWQDGKECGNPISKVHWPAGIEVNDSHKVVLVTQGDAMYASIDGMRLFEVGSLKQALADSKCGYKEPTGTQVGFRTWSGDTKATFTNTTVS